MKLLEKVFSALLNCACPFNVKQMAMSFAILLEFIVLFIVHEVHCAPFLIVRFSLSDRMLSDRTLYYFTECVPKDNKTIPNII